jgi:hypothetical protein
MTAPGLTMNRRKITPVRAPSGHGRRHLDLDSPRIRAALAAVLALSPVPAFTSADLVAMIHTMTGNTDDTKAKKRESVTLPRCFSYCPL